MQLLGKTTGITAAGLMVVIWLMVSFAVLFTIIRTAIRFHVFGRLFADDFWVYLALAILTTIATLYNYAVPIMFEYEQILHGKKLLTHDFGDRARLFLKLQFAIIVLFWTCIWAVKISFLIWYKKLTDFPSNREMMWNLVTGFTVASYLGCWVTQLEACHPIRHYFVSGRCQSKRDIYVSNLSLYYSTAVDIFCDLLIMALPLKSLWTLQINARTKLGLVILVSLVFIIIAFAIVRVVESSASAEHVNPIWLALWSIVEAGVAVIVSCLPSFHILLTSRLSSSSSFRRRRRPLNFQQQDPSPVVPPATFSKEDLSTIDREIAEIIRGHEIETDPDAPVALQKAEVDDGLGTVLPGILMATLYKQDQEDMNSSEQTSEVGASKRDEKTIVLDV